jgi:hypothetical protein
MDAEVNLTARLPSRHEAERAARMPWRVVSGVQRPNAAAVVETFKKTSTIADLKRAGRHVAKEMLEAGAVPLDRGSLCGDGVMAGASATAGNPKHLKMCHAHW